MFQVLLRDQWADAVVWPLVQKACGAFRAGRQSGGGSVPWEGLVTARHGGRNHAVELQEMYISEYPVENIVEGKRGGVKVAKSK